MLVATVQPRRSQASQLLGSGWRHGV